MSKENNDKLNSKSNTISWKIIHTMFKDNPNILVDHHLESFNNFFDVGIFQLIRENNPIKISKNYNSKRDDFDYKCTFYIGGKEGNKLYYGKPVIFDDNHQHYMYPNEARLRNMTYGLTIHYDCDIDITIYDNTKKEFVTQHITLEKILMGKFPIMLNSKLCIYNGINRDLRFYMGECRNDNGGYFIIDGKEKVLVPQEKFADNMLYIKKNDKDNQYSYSAIIRTVSEDASKPIRTLKVNMVASTPDKTYNNIVVELPNVRKPIPLFIVMRALGIISDKDIIKYCILDLEKNKEYLDLFIPCVHDAGLIFSQEMAIQYIASFMKYETTYHASEILINYFLPNVGELNFISKAYFLGHMVFSILKVHKGIENPTDRDSFTYKRVELPGTLIYELFNEYYMKQKKNIFLKIEEDIFYHHTIDDGKNDIVDLDHEKTIKMINDNHKEYFKEKIVEKGFKTAFKGNWGASAHTKRLGIIQDLNRLSGNSYISQLRKINLPLDASAKVVGPRLLHSTQWGIIDPIDTPDGGNIGLHKYMAISASISTGYLGSKILEWMKKYVNLYSLEESYPEFINQNTKVFINGSWVGYVMEPFKTINEMKMYRRLGLIPLFTSIAFHIQKNTIYIFTDSGRLSRPLYYTTEDNVPSVFISDNIEKINSEKRITWNSLIYGFNKRNIDNINNQKIYELDELYDTDKKSLENIIKDCAIIDYIDTNESETSLIAINYDKILGKEKKYTHLEIHPSLMFGVMGNQVIYPENNPPTRNLFSCGQSKQAVSMYHTNYQNRIDKAGIVLNCGQVPLIKSRYLKYINNEEQPYGVNAIVAIMCYTGYNVEDAILVSKGAVDRGLFRTTYYNMYESSEESEEVSGSTSNSIFSNNSHDNSLLKKKNGYNYDDLDENGIIKLNTKVNEKSIVIGKVRFNSDEEVRYDESITPKKGQMGYVDKIYISDNEEGFRVAKVRIRDERIPAIGDKMASRAGQKGTIGLVIPEEDMPYTDDGIRPDLIINPHAIPSRMTIGQLTECLLGKLCIEKGMYGDCTVFGKEGPKEEVIGDMLVNFGYHSSGDQIMYNGLTGEQLNSSIFIGPTYYMRLKHMVKDKINHRSTGPITALTRQTVHGRANDGGLRIGEMERDGVVAHGATSFLRESFMIRGDNYQLAVCNQSGNVAIYNCKNKQFFSPTVDGPIKYSEPISENSKILNISKYGKSFSIVKVPYTFKLLLQELQSMNIQMRIITEDNIEQLMSMSYSDNITKLTDFKDIKNLGFNVRRQNIEKERKDYNKMEKKKNENMTKYGKYQEKTPEEAYESVDKVENNEEENKFDLNPDAVVSDQGFWETGNTPENLKQGFYNLSPAYAPDGSLVYVPNTTPDNTNVNSPPYVIDDSPGYNPNTPEEERTSYNPVSSKQIMENSVLQQDDTIKQDNEDTSDNDDSKSSSSGTKKISITT